MLKIPNELTSITVIENDRQAELVLRNSVPVSVADQHLVEARVVGLNSGLFTLARSRVTGQLILHADEAGYFVLVPEGLRCIFKE